MLVAAKGFEPTFATKVDPLAGPLNVRLEKFNRSGLGPKTKVAGRVVDSKGEPVVGARVDPEGVQRGTGTSWGGLDGVDPLAITDENGEFLITSKQPFDSLSVVIEARSFAKLRKNGLASDVVHTVTLTEGATITGHLLVNGLPLKAVAVGLAGANRGAGEFVGDYQIGTDTDGRFTFLSLPPKTDYFIYGIMDSLKAHGSVPAKRIRTEGDGVTTDIGDLTVAPGLRLAGKVELSDGAKPPPHTRLTVGQDEAWDLQYLELGENGDFEFRGLPPNTAFSVSTRIKGYRISGKNASLDPWNPFMLMGKLNADKTDLKILFEPGPDLNSNHGGSVSPDEHPKNLPLRGAETPKDLSDFWAISGQVIDAESQSPIEQFQITPGRKEALFGPPTTTWQSHRAERHTRGEFTLLLPKRGEPPMLLAEADGYIPAASPALSETQLNYVFRLKKGGKLEGTVLLPNGEPAAGVPVFRFEAREQFGLFPNGQIRDFGRRDSPALTDANGRFSLPPRLGEGTLYVAADQGFAELPSKDLAAGSKITLQAWSRVEGTLMQNGKPAAGETLAITTARTFSTDRPWVNLQHRSVADAQGRFEFDHLPPGELQIVTLVPIDSGGLARGWTHQQQKVITVNPGAVLKLEIEKVQSPQPPAWHSPSQKPVVKP